jgi:hypothetical protein
MSGNSKAQRSQRAPRPASRRTGRRGPMGLDSEQSARLLLFGVTAAVLIAAATFIAIGYYVSVIKPRGRTVLQVEDIKVSYAAMKRRMAYEYYSNATYQDVNTVEFVPQVAYANLVEELTLIQRAESELGLTIDPAKIDEQTRQVAGVGAEADEATFSARYREALSDSRLHKDEFDRLIRAQVIEQAVRDKLAESTPEMVPQAKVEIITTDDIETAQQALARVRAGEPWATVATELSTEPNVATTGGVKDYEFQGRLTPAYDSFAFSGAIGDISEPLQDASGAGPFYIVHIIDRADLPLTDRQKRPYQDKQYEDWLRDLAAKVRIVDNWTNDNEAQVDAGRALIEDAIEKARQRQEEQNRPQPTIDPGAAQTAAAASTAAAETPVASGTPLASTPVPTAPAAEATPVATGTVDGQ